MQKTIVLSSNFPCEIGAAIMYNFLDENSTTISMNTSDAKKFDLVTKLIEEKIEQGSKIMMIGTYWIKCLPDLLEKFPKTKFTLYCFGDCIGLEHYNLTQISGKNGYGPTQYLFDLATSNNSSKNLCKFFKTNFSVVMRYIDDRVYNQNILENQIFYAGLHNYESTDLSVADRFHKLFSGEYDIKELMEIGKKVVSAQMSMARDRVKNNSKEICLNNNVKAVVTEGPDLINLTHDALHQKYPDALVTLVLSMQFSSTTEDQLGYSIRSFNEEIDAQKLAKKIDGDGNKSAAGGKVKHYIPIPF